MIASLRGVVLSKGTDRVVLEAGGVGYEVVVTAATASVLEPGREALLHTAESFGLYGGGATLYGFSSAGDKLMFETFKDAVPGTGAKKALEYLEKASKSLPDFRRAVLDKDARLLVGVFGFTKKTADKLIEALKDRLESVPAHGAERLARAEPQPPTGALGQALAALTALGYRGVEARAALQAVSDETGGAELPAEQIVRFALKRL